MSPLVTDEQLREAVEAYRRTGNYAAASRELGLPRTTVQNRVNRAARKGIAPGHWDSGVAPGYHMGKVTVHRRADGTVIEAWERQHPDEESYYLGVAAAIEEVKLNPPKLRLFPVNPDTSDIIPWLQIGDAHIGMLASETETGANFDIKIGETEICEAASQLIDQAPKCERMVINDLGDGTHYENFKAMTEASGNVLDYDTRYWKMVRAYIRITRFIVEKALTKAQHIDFIANQGNHSRTNDIWIAALVDAVYGATGRVTVLENASPLIAYRMGNTFVMVHHGDKMKPERLREVMAEDYADDWGNSKFRYIDGGHVHHSQRKELAGATFESWNNLAPRDKYAQDHGYRSKQAMSLVLRSRTYGELGRYKMPVEKVRDCIREKNKDHYVPPLVKAFQA